MERWNNQSDEAALKESFSLSLSLSLSHVVVGVAAVPDGNRNTSRTAEISWDGPREKLIFL
jgi:hypothetical protein